MSPLEGQLSMFEDVTSSAPPVQLTRGCLLPFQQSQMIDLARAGKILGIGKACTHNYLRQQMLRGYRASDNLPWLIYYDSVVELCDAMRAKFLIRDRRPRLTGGLRRWRDRDLLPFPLDDTILVRKAAEAFDLNKTVIFCLINDRAAGERGAFDAYRFRDEAPWRISRSSLLAYAEERKRRMYP